MIEPKGKKYANTTERVMAAEKRIVRVTRGLLDLIMFTWKGYAAINKDRRVQAAKKLLKDMHRPYKERS